MSSPVDRLRAELGGMDVYLFDQLVRGRVPDDARVFDGGAGGGRNLRWFLANGFDVRACDPDPTAVEGVRALADELGVALPADAVRAEPLEAHSFADASADLVVVNAVLHFAEDHAHFRAMLDGAFRVLAPGGLFFARLASSIGLEGRRDLGGGRALLPDGSTRYLVDLAKLLAETERLGGTLADPIKTTDVQGLRAMTTWVIRRPA